MTRWLPSVSVFLLLVGCHAAHRPVFAAGLVLAGFLLLLLSMGLSR